MVKRVLIAVIFIYSNSFLIAQEKKVRKEFHSVNSVTLVNGNNSVSANLQSVNGFQKGALFAGLGTAIDYYLYRSVPVFADLRYEFGPKGPLQGKKKNKYFVYGDAGINFNWIQDQFFDDPSIWNGNASNSFKNGMYNDIGLGYNIKMKKEGALVLAIGYSQKNLKETETYLDWRTSELLKRENVYNLRRIMLKVGWQF